MRVLLFCLCLGSLTGCARDDVPLGTEGEDTGGGTNTGNGSTGEDKDSGPDDNNTGNTGDNGNNNGGSNASNGDATSGGEPDAGGSTGEECTPAMCSAPDAELGQFDASDEAASLTHQGTGPAMLKLTAVDNNSEGLSGFNGIIGIEAALTAPAGAYELHILGDLGASSNACAPNETTGTADSVTAIWNGMGPVMPAPDKDLTIEVRALGSACDQAWTVTITGVPCMSPTVPGDSCP